MAWTNPFEAHLKLVTFAPQIKKQQQKITMILDSKKIVYNKLDVAADESLKQQMRDKMGDPKGLPPQLFNGDTYCGVGLLLSFL